MKRNQMTRRRLLQSGAALSVGAGMWQGGVAPSFATSKPIALGLKPQKKALVFIMLDGGNDSFNMLVPTSEHHYRAYQNSRSNLALDRQTLLPLKGATDKEGRSFGLHPAMPDVARLFNQKQLSFVANCGPMIEPVRAADMHSGRAKLPLGLLSHADQFKHWQSARPDQRVNQGWFGSFADALQPNRPAHQIPMNISLAGSNIMQNGVSSSHYSIQEQGSVGLVVNEEDTPLNQVLLASFEQLLQTDYGSDPFKQSYLSQTREAQAQHEVFRRGIQPFRLPVDFPDTPLAQQLAMVARSIAAADGLNHQQQTFFLRYIGWDHHDELLQNHAAMLGVLSEALGTFQQALQKMGLADQVVTFTGSDFGRTLTSNGNGTDHGWGGNTMVMGADLAGGRVVGSYPDLTLGDRNDLDAGDGVIIPTTAIEQIYAEIAHWFGVEKPYLSKLFPNVHRFTGGRAERSLGLFKS
ncbi:DUF1501 domain-containing protein [Magnetococcus sp. PR-3]|uniref:DUF1501 domain-containing protein n=1 Tax=Magnetococcus sp. PR-3 TaxID=3120355 RepID=UPI002FCE12D9